MVVMAAGAERTFSAPIGDGRGGELIVELSVEQGVQAHLIDVELLLLLLGDGAWRLKNHEEGRGDRSAGGDRAGHSGAPDVRLRSVAKALKQPSIASSASSR
jgi:hypothetical protein